MDNKKDDLTDIQNQLTAISDWLIELEKRLVRDHSCLGSKHLGRAASDVSLAFQSVNKELCKFQPS